LLKLRSNETGVFSKFLLVSPGDCDLDATVFLKACLVVSDF